MQRHYSYPYSAAQAPAVTRYGSGTTNSAHSASANPDEDWTKISDLAERRRIQNRIAQRNYRKKLKRRLEDLERRAGSSSASPEQQPAELHSSRASPDDGKKRRTSRAGSTSLRTTSRSPVPSMTPAFNGRDDMFTRQHTRQVSASPPPTFTYNSFQTTADAQVHPSQPPASYPQHAPYNTLPAPYPDYQGQSSVYLPPLPMTRPHYGSFDSATAKQENHFPEEEVMSHFSMNYPSVAADLVSAPPAVSTQSYADSSYVTSLPESSRGYDPSGAPSPKQPMMNFNPPIYSF